VKRRLAILLLGMLGAAAAAQERRPDVVLIVTDDQPHHTLEFMPATVARLGGAGVTFTNAMASESICCPSRASLLTGLYSRAHGVLSNGHGARAFDDRSTLATWLHDAGYRTGYVGKYLNHYADLRPWPYVPPGWDDWRAHIGTNYFDYRLLENGDVVFYGSDPDDYEVDVVARKAVEFIEAAPPAQPLFLVAAPYGPHSPATPHPDLAGAFAGQPGWRSPNHDVADVADKPDWVRRLPPLHAREIEALDGLYRRQLEVLQSVDRAVAAILEALERTGRLEDAVVVYTTDNGYSLGAHRWDRKSCVYEECTRVPLIVRAPGVLPRLESRVTVNVDLAATIVDLAGVTPPAPLHGRSLVPLLRDPSAPWADGRLLELLVGGARQYEAVRTERFLYAEYANGDVELYDLHADPFQLENVAASSAYEVVLQELRGRLAQLRIDPRGEGGEPGADPDPPPGADPDPTGGEDPDPAGGEPDPVAGGEGPVPAP
jgi:arylsulfatase A-like enzyme